jgi:hypothetical protein
VLRQPWKRAEQGLTEAAPMADGGARRRLDVREERSRTGLYTRGRSVGS